MQLDRQQIHSIIENYLTIFPEEREELAPLFQFLEKTSGDLYDRKNMDGHIVGSAIILDTINSNTLLIYHNTFKRYQQPGGHIDPGEDPLCAAIRESAEETGIVELDYKAMDHTNIFVPIHISCHIVHPNTKKQEGKHWHFNCNYVFQTQQKPTTVQDDGVRDAQWFALDRIEEFLPKIPRKMKVLFSID